MSKLIRKLMWFPLTPTLPNDAIWNYVGKPETPYYIQLDFGTNEHNKNPIVSVGGNLLSSNHPINRGYSIPAWRYLSARKNQRTRDKLLKKNGEWRFSLETEYDLLYIFQIGFYGEELVSVGRV